MNNVAKAVVLEFVSNENAHYLREILSSHFDSPSADHWLAQNLEMMMERYVDRLEQELSLSEPLPGITILDQVNSANNQFTNETIEFIQMSVEQPKVAMYMVNDGLPTSRRGLKHHQQPANKILETWAMNAGRPVQSREDPQNIYTRNNYSDGYNPYNGQGDAHMQTGIVFCDQSELGLQNHIDQYNNTAYKRELNRPNPDRLYEETVFGISTPASDARLLSRRTFRNNERGEENGIPSYEQRLYRRRLERDIDEGLRGGERGCMLSGYDMGDLYKRVDYKNRAHSYYDPNCTERTRLLLEHNSHHVPHSMRYS
jgi:hypothetical protein